MKRLLWFAAVFAAVGAVEAFAVNVSENDGVWIIETDTYVLHFRETNRAGYAEIYPSTQLDAVSLVGPDQPRTFYHSAQYDGWVQWGNATDVEEILNANKTLIMEYEVDDGNSKRYLVTATYWDGAPYWKHEVVVEAKNPVVSFSDAHEPMSEPRNGMGANNEYQAWDDPIAHAAFANENGFFAFYTEMGSAIAVGEWQADGRMHLNHNALGVQLEEGGLSDPLVYYMAAGTGDLNDAHELADIVTEVPASLSVDPMEKLAAHWADLKRSF